MRNTRTTRSASAVITCLLLAVATVTAADWNKIWSLASGDDVAKKALLDADNRVYTLGQSEDSEGDTVAVVFRCDANGNNEAYWVYEVDSSAVHPVDFVLGTRTDSTGTWGVLYVAACVSNGTDLDFHVLQFDTRTAQSLPAWSDVFDGGHGDDRPVAIALLGTGVVVTGESQSASDGCDYLTGAYYADGSYQWSPSYVRHDRAGLDDRPTALFVEGEEDNILITGSSEVDLTELHIWTVMYDASGSEVWSALVDDPGWSESVGLGIAVVVREDDYSTTHHAVVLGKCQVAGPYWASVLVSFETGIEDPDTTPGFALDTCVYAREYYDRVPAAMVCVDGDDDLPCVYYTLAEDSSSETAILTVKYEYDDTPSFNLKWETKTDAGTGDGPKAIGLMGFEDPCVAGDLTDSNSDMFAHWHDQETGKLRARWTYDTTYALSTADIVGSPPYSEWIFLSGTVDGSSDKDIVVLRRDAPRWPLGWDECTSMPLTSSGKPVKRGGWLACNSGDSMIYAAKGYKTSDFYRYDPVGDTWTELADVPPGAEGKLPQKGCKGISDGDNLIYMTKGYNTYGYWQYKIDADSWTALTNVPAGSTGKKVKGGTDLVFVTHDGTDYVYMLKGYKTEFWRYNTGSGVWESRAAAPTGIKYKWNKGSWIVYDGDATIYAHKARYYNRATYKHEFWKYDIPGDSWYTTPLAGMPLYGLHSGRIKKKKAKDGGAGAKYGDEIWALKGGNTQQFWMYDIPADTWTEQDTVPNNGSTGRKKRVKYGADLVHWGDGAFFALKGNKTREMWRYLSRGSSFVGWRSGAYASGKPGGGGTDDEQPLFEGYEAYRPRWNEGGTWVVYHREDDDGDLQIYASGTEGQGEVQITDVETDCEYPAFNPDGDKIAFQIDDTTSGFYQIAVVDFEEFGRDVTSAPVLPVAQVPLKSPPDASAPLSAPVRGPSRTTSPVDVPVAAPAPVSAPVSAPQAMSPPETASVLLSHLVPRSVPAWDDDITLLTDNDYDHEYPEWSPTSNHICYQRDDDSGYTQIYQVQASGGDEEQLTEDEADHEMPVWLDDGNIAYVYSPNEDYDQIAMFDIIGDSQVILTDEETDHAMPAAYQDGDSICFQAFDEWGMYQIGKVSASGGDEEFLTEEDIDCENPVWSDDGSAIFCTGWRYPGTEIALVDAQAGGYDAQTDSSTIRDHPDVWYDELGTASNYVVYEREGDEEEPGMDGTKPPRKKKKGTGVYLIRVVPSEHDGAQDAGQFRLAVTRTVPNPSIGRVAVRWQTPVMQRVSLKAFDVTGRLVRTLVNDEVAAGVYDCVWNCTDTQGRKLASGIYFLSLSAGGEEMRRKVVIAGAE